MNSSLSYTDTTTPSVSDIAGIASAAVVVQSRMSDEEREAAARRAGCAMQAWYAEYRRTGDQRCLKVAHHHMNQMVQILAGRSPEYVAKLEQERGLA